jgi:sec-independent protein translocase protein TatB
MEFLGIGYQELLLVFVLLLVVVGPERLPSMAYQIGKAVRTMQKYARAVRDEFKDEFDYVEEQVKVVRGEIDVARVAVREQQRAFNSEMQAINSDLQVDLPPLLESGDSPPSVSAFEPSSNGSVPAATQAEAAPVQSTPGGKPPLVF